MTMPSQPATTHRQLIIGLPATGKTTFLAALWHVVTSKELPDSLQLLKLEGNRRHLNTIRTAWLQFREVGRTVSTTEEIVSMNLARPGASDLAQLVFPDLSGESFRKQWVERKWTKEYDDLVSDAGGILLFVHPLKVTAPDRIDAALEEVVAALEDEDDRIEDARAIDNENTLPEWNAAQAPTQVQLVELLQVIDWRRDDQTRVPVAVVVSAWDLMVGSYSSPVDWLSQRMPLLDQYLKANSERFPSRIYGISAQGAPLDGDVAVLQKRERQSERIIVVGEGCSQHDITAPVKWLMETV